MAEGIQKKQHTTRLLSTGFLNAIWAYIGGMALFYPFDNEIPSEQKDRSGSGRRRLGAVKARQRQGWVRSLAMGHSKARDISLHPSWL